MRQTQLFSGSSHPQLAQSICDWLGQKLGEADLGKFANGETMVQIRQCCDRRVWVMATDGGRDVGAKQGCLHRAERQQ
jgi:phosphoribosylpyrophosphate synthetase